MPTYINNSLKTFLIESATGRNERVEPGGQVETYLLAVPEGLEKVSDDPVFNPVVAVRADLAGTAEAGAIVDVPLSVDSVEVINLSSSGATMRLNHADNSPGFHLPAGSVFRRDGLEGRVNSLIFTFTGEVTPGDLIVSLEKRGL